MASVGREREIGVNGKLPWHLPEDLRRFREITTNHPIIMGRKTFESIGRPLKGRTNIIVTQDNDFEVPEGCVLANSFQTALEIAGKEATEIFVIGGAGIYAQALQVADRMYLTEVDLTIPNADTFFPPFDKAEWQVVQTLAVPQSESNSTGYSYVVYERIEKP